MDEDNFFEGGGDLSEDYQPVGNDEVYGGGDDENAPHDAFEQEEMQESESKNSKGEYGLTDNEIKLGANYDSILGIVKSSKTGADSNSTRLIAEYVLGQVVNTVVLSSLKNTSNYTAEKITKDIMQKQGHARIPATVYSPEPLRGSDLDSDFFMDEGSDSEAETERMRKELQRLIDGFVDYLANRDTSKDSVVMKKKKARHLPAFILYMFNLGAYQMMIDCQTMPRFFKKQIDSAMAGINKQKYDIVESLARRYEEKGRPLVAERVRQLQLAWFDKEPSMITGRKAYEDLDLTFDDVLTYREFRSKFINTSKTITLEVISDYIEVCDPSTGVYYKLKDKTRYEAIIEVKELWKEYCKDNADTQGQELANNLMFKK